MIDPNTAPSQTAKPTTTTTNLPRLLTLGTLILILVLGSYLRFTGLNWDDYTHLHPDERFLTIVTSKLERPGALLTYMRTSESPLNPYNKGEGFYVYGNFPMTVTFFVGQWAESIRGFACDETSVSTFCRSPLTGYDGIHLVGRFLSGTVDIISILFTFLIGKQIYGRRVGLLAAFFMATAVMAIQQSHFYTMDNWAAALTTIAMYTAVRASQEGEKYHWWTLFGIFLGLAVSSRINVAPLALMAGVAGIVWLGNRYHTLTEGREVTIYRTPWVYLRTFTGRDDIQMIIIGGLTAAIVSMLVFRVAMPYAFADATTARETYLVERGVEPSFTWVALQSIVGFNGQWLGNLEEIQRLQAPEASFPPAVQWVDRTNILFPLTNMLLYGMGPLAGLLAWIGFGVAFWRIVRGRPDWVLHALPVAWTALYFFFSATRWVKSIRYFLPIYPILFLLGAWLLIHLYDKYKKQPAHRSSAYRFVAPTLIITAALTSLIWANAFVEIYRQPLTRVAASQWMFENVPTAATLIYEDSAGQRQEMNLQMWQIDLAAESPAYPLQFQLPEDGQIQAVRFNYLKDADGIFEDSETIRLSFDTFYDESTVRNQQDLALEATRQSQEIPLQSPFLTAEEPHTIFVDLAEGGNIRFETSVITSEHWDDALPTRYAGKDPYSQFFRGLSSGQMVTTHPDSAEKRDQMAQQLDEADIIAISSQRSLWSLPRIPLTYPLMIRYYEALFGGELGFELVAEFHGDLRVGPLYISDTTGQIGWGERPNVGWPPPGDLAVEEAFSVYDHPPVWIFQKTAAYDPVKTREVLGTADVSRVTHMNPLEATQAPNALMLTPEQAEIQQEGGTFRELFNPDGLLSNNGLAASIVWWTAVILLGWLTFPICYFLLRGLPDRGYALSRILSIALIAYFGWISASLGWLPNTRGTLWLAILILLVTAALILSRRGLEIQTFIRENWRHLLTLELIGVALFLFFIFIRLGNPDAWHVIWGGEKPMDTAYFTAVLKSTTFPPYDPWHAGGYINYYYYGFVYAGALTKLLRIVPTTAYNLILPMLFSFTALSAYSLAHGLLVNSPAVPAAHRYNRATLAGVSAMILTVLLGNLGEVSVVFTAWLRASTLPESASSIARLLQGGWQVLSGQRPAPIYPGDWFWTASRAIGINAGEVAPITEFPFFTFLYGDLHAHMIALPLALLALGWAIGLALQKDKLSWGQFFLGAFAIGVLYPTNSWDYPTYLVIGLLALIYLNINQDGLTLKGVATAGTQFLALFGLSIFAYWPFWENFGTAYGSLRAWEGSYTSLADYLVVYGLFLLIAITYLFVDLKQWAQTIQTEQLAQATPWTSLSVVGSFVLIPTMVWGVGRGYEVFPLALSLVLFAGLLAIRRQSSPQRRIVNTLISSAVALTIFVEIFVLEGDIGRMNTVFKFYMQVWVMLSIACGAGIAWTWQRMQIQWGETGRTIWLTTLAALVFAAALYPILATRGKWVIREQRDIAPRTLDGMAFMAYTSYGDSGQTITLAEDYRAIQWIQRNIDGSPVMLEAHSGNPYRSIGNRIAMYTGLPAVIGWDWHQRQQRPTVPHHTVTQRISDVNIIYSHDDSAQAYTLLQQYDVSYIYVGQLERVYYGINGALKFERMAQNGLLAEVYNEDGVIIYKVLD